MSGVSFVSLAEYWSKPLKNTFLPEHVSKALQHPLLGFSFVFLLSSLLLLLFLPALLLVFLLLLFGSTGAVDQRLLGVGQGGLVSHGRHGVSPRTWALLCVLLHWRENGKGGQGGNVGENPQQVLCNKCNNLRSLNRLNKNHDINYWENSFYKVKINQQLICAAVCALVFTMLNMTPNCCVPKTWLLTSLSDSDTPGWEGVFGIWTIWESVLEDRKSNTGGLPGAAMFVKITLKSLTSLLFFALRVNFCCWCWKKPLPEAAIKSCASY